MADKEKLDDIILKKCIQDAYGLSKEEQLLKEMEEAGQSLDDAEFPGAGERMFKRIMEMEAAEKSANKAGLPSADEIAANAAIAASAGTVSSAGNAANAEVAASAGAAGNVETTGVKIVRFRRKKLVAVAALVAVLVGVLGVTAIGEKNYFFRQVISPDYRENIDNDANKMDISSLEQAYTQIEELGIPALKLGYVPSEFIFESTDVFGNNIMLTFDYKENKFHVFQETKRSSTSKDINSDREDGEIVYNEWLKKDIIIRYNNLENQKTEYSVEINIDKNVYRLEGIIDISEFEKIIKNLHF